MKAYILQNAAWLGPLALWLFSAAISSMPAPDSTSGKAYRWLYGFFHTVSGNLDKVSTSIKPPMK